ncbi:MAG: hypothetical protein GF334_02820 [Candidatus Altiarchaeales archaeon]|nr:hypothetical protein [Candidatus Altiarchaeales archaeon]
MGILDILRDLFGSKPKPHLRDDPQYSRRRDLAGHDTRQRSRSKEKGEGI